MMRTSTRRSRSARWVFCLKQTSSHKPVRGDSGKFRTGNTFFQPFHCEAPSAIISRSRRTAAGGSRRKSPRLTSARDGRCFQLIAEGKAKQRDCGGTRHQHQNGGKNIGRISWRKLNIHEISGLTRYAIGAGIIGEQRPVDGSARRMP